MAEQIITVREPPSGVGEAKVAIDDFIRFGEIIDRVVHLWHSVTNLAVGATQKLTTLKVHFGDGEYEWDMGSIKRTK